MNETEFNVAMLRGGYNAPKMAKALDMSYTWFRKKKSGGALFDMEEIKTISRLLDLDINQVNVIFFGGEIKYA